MNETTAVHRKEGHRYTTVELSTILTNVSLAAKTPPSKGVSFGPIMSASQVKMSDSEMGPMW